MSSALSFHSFTYGGQTFSGEVTAVSLANGELKFDYSYRYEGIQIDGSLCAVKQEGARYAGTWTETSQRPVNGRTKWTGAALLAELRPDDRVLFAGDWGMARGSLSERWVIDILI